jgi:hypothetical protein
VNPSRWHSAGNRPSHTIEELIRCRKALADIATKLDQERNALIPIFEY